MKYLSIKSFKQSASMEWKRSPLHMCSAQHPSLVHNLVHKLAWSLLVHNLVHKAQAVKLQKKLLEFMYNLCTNCARLFHIFYLQLYIKTKYLSNEPRCLHKVAIT